MAMPKRTFGQNIEDGLTFLGDGIHRAVMEAKNHELETIKLGLISDSDKLRMLKRDLYEAARSRANPEHIQNLRSAIATISQQLENERNHRNSPTELMFGFLNSIILLGLLAAFVSFPVAWTCDGFNSHSQACEGARVIPKVTVRFFKEPK